MAALDHPPPPAQRLHGTVLFTRYAFMPNHLERCGPLRAQDNRTIFEYAVAGHTDPYFTSLLREFQAAYPYLQLIARTTGHTDPFDPAVVEAYWIGSDLLERVEVRAFHDSIRERFGARAGPKQLEWLLGKAPAGARPHHSFNVFDVQRFTQERTHTLHNMEQCRIGWGRIVSAEPAHYVVEHQPLEWVASAPNGRGGLGLGAPRLSTVLRHMHGKGFTEHASLGDWVALHWGWACDLLTEPQRAQLERWTLHHLRLANETL
ncbi:MAG TPA: DUF6390 family protein [Chloroflexota bacterium]|nr:DUF6390 family protein [Chloroflexota bacterium]